MTAQVDEPLRSTYQVRLVTRRVEVDGFSTGYLSGVSGVVCIGIIKVSNFLFESIATDEVSMASVESRR
jgi:hypothetical protein